MSVLAAAEARTAGLAALAALRDTYYAAALLGSRSQYVAAWNRVALLMDTSTDADVREWAREDVARYWLEGAW